MRTHEVLVVGCCASNQLAANGAAIVRAVATGTSSPLNELASVVVRIGMALDEGEE